MGEPRDIHRAHISPAAAKRVLVAIDTEDAGDTGSREGKAYPRIAGYTIERVLGRGAGGVTYLAHKAGSEARIALKVLHARPGDGRASQRAWRELDTLQQVRVPSVPRLLDFGTTDHSLYIATEYIEGTPLSELYEHARPADLAEMRERVRLLEKIARAAHSLHEKGVIHRDLKPSNVIVTPGAPKCAGDRAGGTAGRAGDGAGKHGDGADSVGEPFIIDLGIALIDSPDLHQTLTQDGHPVGTPAFMAPEQARGKREEISTRSDIYSLGAIGYWLCTGETPHDLTGVTLHEAIRRVGSEAAREARGISKAVPKGLGAVLGKACGGRQDDRYGSADDLAEDLLRWIRKDPVHAHPAAPWRRLMRWIERHPVLASSALSVSIILLSIVFATAGTWYLYRVPHALVLDEDTRTLRLVSRSKSILHEWRWSEGGRLIFADLIEAPGREGPRMRVATVIEGGLGLDATPNAQLCVWDALHPGRLLWHTESGPGYIRAPKDRLPPATASDFLNNEEFYDIGAVLLADVFPTLPGDEMVVIHQHSYDPSGIRVYDADGTMLSEVWHWGSASDPIWHPGQGLLVLRGCNNEHPLSAYVDLPTSFRWPRVIFAVRPVLGRSAGWVNPRLARTGEAASWYKALLPLEAADLVGSSGDESLSLAPQERRTAVCEWTISAAESEAPGAARTFFINASGVVVAHEDNDIWRQRSPSLDRVGLKLGELPEPKPEHR